MLTLLSCLWKDDANCILWLRSNSSRSFHQYNFQVKNRAAKTSEHSKNFNEQNPYPVIPQSYPVYLTWWALHDIEPFALRSQHEHESRIDIHICKLWLFVRPFPPITVPQYSKQTIDFGSVMNIHVWRYSLMSFETLIPEFWNSGFALMPWHCLAA